MSVEVKQLIEFATQDLIAEIVEHDGVSIREAMDKLYRSAFFNQLSNPELCLYRESGAYLYAAFKAYRESEAKIRPLKERMLCEK